MDARGLHGLAASQRWLLKRDQVLEFLTEPQLGHALRRRELVPVFDRVYKPWGAPEWWEQLVQAACWSVDAVASHRSSARLRGIEVAALRIELCVPWPRQVRMRGVKVHRSNILLPEFVTDVDGIPATTADRTCVDLASCCSPDVLERAWSSAEYKGLVTAESILRTLIKMRARGRRRTTVADELLQSWVPGLDIRDIDLEGRTLRWILDAGIEPPEVQFWIVVNGLRYCLDFAWPAKKICVECDGWGSHKTRLRFDGDRDKIPELELAGWLAIPVTSRQTREVVIGRIRRAFAQR